MEALDCPRALTVSLLLRNEEWDQLTSLDVNPSHYTLPDQYRRAALATEFLRKFDGFPLGLDLDKATLDKWFWAEKECFRTNRLLNEFMDFGTLRGVPATDSLLQFITAVRKNIEWAIGSRPPATWEGRFGPGATVRDVSRYATILDKMSSVPAFTPNSWHNLVPWSGTAWATASAELGRTPVSVRGNTYFTVPKTSRTRRACAKEPSINGFYQLGLGRVMRRRLGKIGIDLVNGQETHRRVALESSVNGSHATIDLSSASDCVSSALVRLLLPHGWFSVLDDLRSHFTRVKGTWHRLEKFSSMGNGFTFELETAIFLGIALTLCPGHRPGDGVWVYGDDIIVPTEFASEVVSALKFFGFTANERKTFLEGNFRESCGGDFFCGESVRAHYMEELPDEPQKFISLANGIRRAALQDSSLDLWHNLRPTWFKCLDEIPSVIRRVRGPQALGDVVIHDDEERWDVRWRNSIRYIRSYRPVSLGEVRWGGFAYAVQMAAALYGVACQTREDGRVYEETRVVGRYSQVSYKVGWVAFS